MNHYEDTAGKDPDAYTRAVIEQSLLNGDKVKDPDIEKGEFDPVPANLADSLAAIICWVGFGIIIGLLIAGFFLQVTD